MFSALPGRWLTLAFVLLTLALCLGNLILLAGAIYALLIVLVGAALAAPSGIVVNRSTPRLVCWAGDGLDVDRQVKAGGGVGPLYVYDRLPPEAEVVSGNNLRVIWKRPGAKTYDLSYRISWPKRGVYTLGETAWEAEAPLGLHRRVHGSAGPSMEISVVPRTQAIRRINQIRGRAHSRNPWEDVAIVGISSTDFTELRPYTPGDPMRWINWKASARSSGSANPLLVNQYEPEGRKAVWIFLDGADYMDVGSTLSALIDQAVEAASSIAQYYLTRGYTLGAYIYNSQSDILTPEVGQKQFRRLTQYVDQARAGPAQAKPVAGGGIVQGVSVQAAARGLRRHAAGRPLPPRRTGVALPGRVHRRDKTAGLLEAHFQAQEPSPGDPPGTPGLSKTTHTDGSPSLGTDAVGGPTPARGHPPLRRIGTAVGSPATGLRLCVLAASQHGPVKQWCAS